VAADEGTDVVAVVLVADESLDAAELGAPDVVTDSLMTPSWR